VTVKDSLHSLLDYECLFFYSDWLGSALLIGTYVSLKMDDDWRMNELRTGLSNLCLSLVLRPKVSRSVCLGIKHPFGDYDQIFITLKVAGLLMWGALSDERMGLSFTIAAGASQRNHSRVRVPWDSRPYFIVSDSRLPFSSPPTTRRATVELFEPRPHVRSSVIFHSRISRSASQSVC
jgi:hypothetical protein